MKALRIKFVDFCGEEFFTWLLSRRFDIIKDDNPEFIFFGDENFGTENLKYSRSLFTKIFFTGENRRPENYDCDYAVTFDHNFNEWHYRLPGYAIAPFGYRNDYPINTLFNIHNTKFEKTDFCAFIHRNGGCRERNYFFNLLNSYKKVNAAGYLFNNTGFIVENTIKAKIEYCKKHKFVMAFENGSHPGYVTEKILDGFYSNSIPIYWGSKTVGIDFNTDAFINGHDFNSFEELLEYIVKIDKDDALYNNIVSQPKLKYNLPTSVLIYNNFLHWFDSVVYEKRSKRK